MLVSSVPIWLSGQRCCAQPEGSSRPMAITAPGAYYRPFEANSLTEFHSHLFTGIIALAAPNADQVVRGMLGTYHERLGDQRQQQSGAVPAGWGRVYGSSNRQSFAGTVSPTLNSSVTGFQVGSDVYVNTNDAGQTQRVGLFVGHSTLKGNVKGFNGGWQDLDAGKTTLRGATLVRKLCKTVLVSASAK